MICSTNKKTYFSQRCAERDMRKILEKRKKNKSIRRFKPTYAYQCHECGFWHLTSWKKK